MGFFSNVFGLARHKRQAVEVAPVAARSRGFRRCRIEQMEDRRMMSAEPIKIGAVYYDPGTGFDETPNTIRVSWIGGAPGTELKKLIINTDKDLDGLGPADTFFDIAPDGPGSTVIGAYGYHPFAQQVDNGSGIVINSVHVVDGGTLLELDLSGFTAGKTLVFTIDVDEMGSKGKTNAVAEGAEFEFSILTGTFSALHYFDITGQGDFHDDFDDDFAGSNLNLPKNDYLPFASEASPVLTAGAIFGVQQKPMPSTISGYVFDDTDIDNFQDPGELGIANVSLSLKIWNGLEYVDLPVVTTTTTDASGFYKFENLLPGKYRVEETQPTGYFSVGARAGNIAGSPMGVVVSPDIISEVVLGPDEKSEHNDYAEARPALISGYVYADMDNDGVKDAGESGIPGTTLYLLNAALDVVGTTQTDALGFYAFTNLFPGSYTVSEDQPAGYLDGEDTIGTAGGLLVPPDGMTDIVLYSGTNGLFYNFGELVPAKISGMVHADRNGDCIYQPGEILLAGVTIQLINNQGQVVKTTQTNAQGEYEFDNLPPGTYTVHELQPSGYFQGGNMVGTASGTSLDFDTIAAITLTPGLQGEHYNFCEEEPASIAGMVHADRDGDCLYDPGEPLLAGVIIQLINDKGQVVGTTTTDAMGEYKFSNLPKGVYTVHEVQPAGYYQGGNMLGSVGGIVVDLDTMTTLLNPAINGVNYNFCEQEPASIAGMVHADRDGDCMYDPGEPLLAGVVIQLINDKGQVVGTTTTDAMGEYKFSNLAPGVYTVHELQPAGYYQGGNSLGSVDGIVIDVDTMTTQLNAAVNGVNYNFCEQEPASIAGMVHSDTDGDCMWDPGEALLSGVVIQLINDKGQIVATTQTDAQGKYSFNNLPPGVYAVHEVQPSGYFQGGNSLGSAGGVVHDVDTLVSIPLTAGVYGVEYNFCEVPPASISGKVYVDTNGDCMQDPGEPNLAGVTIQLYNSIDQLVGTTVTDTAGNYSFKNLPPGVYKVREVQPAGYYQGGNNVGSAGGTAIDIDTLGGIALAGGVNGINYDFCELPPGSISGMIHLDIDGDCMYDPGEPLLAGVTVQLKNPLGQVVAETVTDANGNYIFQNLPPGTYTVHEVQPAGYFQAGNSIGSIGGTIIDSDTIGGIVLGGGVHAVEYNFCEQTGVCLMGSVFVDVNKNGKLDGNDRPIAGVLIELLDANGVTIATTTTSAGGAYQFCDLTPGTYGVRETQPVGFEDDADYLGSLGGKLDNDLMTEITLTLGVNGTEYNFTEISRGIVFQTQLVFPELLPMAMPPQLPYLQYYTPPADPLKPFALDYGGGYALGFTWHLSVIDAGRPRGEQVGGHRVATISTGPDPFQVANKAVHDSQWLLGMPGVDSDGVETSRVIRFGMRNGIPVTGDFNGDGATDVGFYYNGQWYIDLNGNGIWDSSDLWAKLGYDGDKPVTGDWDGDGKTDIGIFGRAWPGDPHAVQQEPGLPAPNNKRTGKQKNVPPETEQAALGYRTMKHTAQGEYRSDLIDHVFHYGTPGDIPITGDWDGSGIHTIGLFTKGQWILDADGDGRWTEDDIRFEYGRDGDRPVVGDFNGDGVDELGIYRDGVWYVDTNKDRVLDARDKVFELGGAGDLPVVGDWNGDGIDEPGVYQQGPSSTASTSK